MPGKNSAEGEKYIQSLFRALKTLEYVAEHGNVAGLTEISKGNGDEQKHRTRSDCHFGEMRLYASGSQVGQVFSWHKAV